MLARANRLITADDFRVVLRKGRRNALPNSVVSLLGRQTGDPARFGFIVTKKVGNAVKRNLVRRRMKAIARELVDSGFTGADVVVRALPSSVEADWSTMRTEISTGLNGTAMKASVI